MTNVVLATFVTEANLIIAITQGAMLSTYSPLGFVAAEGVSSANQVAAMESAVVALTKAAPTGTTHIFNLRFGTVTTKGKGITMYAYGDAYQTP